MVQAGSSLVVADQKDDPPVECLTQQLKRLNLSVVGVKNQLRRLSTVGSTIPNQMPSLVDTVDENLTQKIDMVS